MMVLPAQQVPLDNKVCKVTRASRAFQVTQVLLELGRVDNWAHVDAGTASITRGPAGQPLLDRRDDARVGVARVRDADPAAVVEVALAVGRDQPGALAPVDDEVRDPAPDGRDDGAVGQGSGGRLGPRVGHDSTVRIGAKSRAAWRRCPANGPSLTPNTGACRTANP